MSKQAAGYDDLDGNGNLSPGDRVHYRVDYGNPGPLEVTGALLHDLPDMARFGSVEAIVGGGTFDGTAIQWSIGTLAAGASGYVTYDLVLRDAAAFDGGALTTTTAAPATSESSTTTAPPATDSTTTTPTTDSATTTAPPTTTSTTILNGSVDVANTVSLTVDGQDPVSTVATVTVTLGAAALPTAATPTTAPTADSTTTTTSTTLMPRTEVVDTAVLGADNRTPLSASVVIYVAPAGSPVTTSTTSTTTPTTDGLNVVAPASLTLEQQPNGAPSTTTTTVAEIRTIQIPTAVSADAAALTLSAQALGYDDLDANGDLSVGDRVHYRIDYANPGPEEVTGATLRDELDTAYVASVEAITGDGTTVAEPVDGVATLSVQWNTGTLAAGASGFVTYDVVLRDAPEAVRDGWFFPVQGPNQYSDSFGAPRYAGGYHPHKGTDIMCADGTPLVAVVGGMIGRADPIDEGLGGRYIWLRGDDGNGYYYAHLSALQDGIVPGVRVKAGQVIGFAGSTGDARGGAAHLHFEIHPAGGSAVDPYLVLKGVLLVSEVPKPALEVTTASTTTTTTPTTLPTTDTTTTDTTTTDTTTPTDVTSTGTTTTTEPPVIDSTTTTLAPPATDTTATTSAPVSDTTTTSAPVSDTTTTSAAPATDTTTTTAPAPVAVTAVAFAVPGLVLWRLPSRKRTRRRNSKPPEHHT